MSLSDELEAELAAQLQEQQEALESVVAALQMQHSADMEEVDWQALEYCDAGYVSFELVVCPAGPLLRQLHIFNNQLPYTRMFEPSRAFWSMCPLHLLLTFTSQKVQLCYRLCPLTCIDRSDMITKSKDQRDPGNRIIEFEERKLVASGDAQTDKTARDFLPRTGGRRCGLPWRRESQIHSLPSWSSSAAVS